MHEVSSPPEARASGAEIAWAWTRSGMIAGPTIGGCYGAVIGPGTGDPGLVIIGLPIGALIGLIAGFAVGLLTGLLLVWLRPAPGHMPLAAAVAIELILLPLQVLLWFTVHSLAYLPWVAAPSAVIIGVAAALGRRLPPGAGSRTAGKPHPE